jgi:hypothetical protein
MEGSFQRQGITTTSLRYEVEESIMNQIRNTIGINFDLTLAIRNK